MRKTTGALTAELVPPAISTRAVRCFSGMLVPCAVGKDPVIADIPIAANPAPLGERWVPAADGARLALREARAVSCHPLADDAGPYPRRSRSVLRRTRPLRADGRICE